MAVVTSDTWTVIAKIWRDALGKSLMNAWASCSIHFCEVLKSTPRNEDWIVSVKFHASPEKQQEESHKFSGFQPRWWLTFVPPPLIPSPPWIEIGVTPGAQQTLWTYCPEDSQALQLQWTNTRTTCGSTCAHSGRRGSILAINLQDTFFQAILQRSWLHIFPNLLMGERQEVHKSGEFSTLFNVSWMSWNCNTMLKYCRFSYVIFECSLLQTLLEWV